jgi:Ca2+-binding EF-hand superfamily protein
VLDVAFSSNASDRATARVAGGRTLPKGVQVRELADGDVEFAIGRVRLDLHVDDGATAAENARRLLSRRFQAADTNKDGYLEGKELAGENAAGSPLAGLTALVDRDGDGKLYPKELADFVDRQIEAARGRLVFTTSDQGRAIFGILDLNRDRRLGAREVNSTVDRVTSWDADHDGRVAADEVPYHFQVSITRGELSGLAVEGTNAGVARSMTPPRPAGASAGPDWFRKMDRNRDGDVSRREFLGPREQFDRLDRDKDGLIDADEAGAAKGSAKAPGSL